MKGKVMRYDHIPDTITKKQNNLRVSNAILLDISIVLIDNRGAFIGC